MTWPFCKTPPPLPHRLDVHGALCDNVDTRSALDAIRDLVAEANKYMNASSKVRIESSTRVVEGLGGVPAVGF